MNNVMLIGGIYHPFDEYVEEICALGRERGVDTLVTESVEEAVEALESADLFTIYALRWRMLNHEKYVPHRPRWSYAMPPELGAQIASFVTHGGSLWGLHTASICFDTWDGYVDVLGGIWVWDKSFHPDPSIAQVETLGDHPAIGERQQFEVHDEVYHDLKVLAESTPLLRARTASGAWQTVAWAHEFGDGRVVYNALGHNGASLRQPGHRQFLRANLDWLLNLA